MRSGGSCWRGRTCTAGPFYCRSHGILWATSSSRSGDRAAFEKVTDRYRPRLEALIRLRLGTELGAKVEVDDIVQKTLLKGFTSIDTLRTENESAFFGRPMFSPCGACFLPPGVEFRD